MKLSIILKQARLNKGLTQRALADKIKLPYQSVQFWETGRRKPDVKNMYKLSKELDIDLSQITLQDYFEE